MHYSMKGALGALAVAMIVPQAAMAADMAVKASPRMAVAAPWTGFYAGVNVGYGWAHESTDVSPAGVVLGSFSNNMRGVVGGGQLGYNWQFGTWVAGLETDLQFSGQRNSSTDIIGPTTFAHTDKITWFGTTRARLGALIMPATLLYGTGGLAYAGMKSDGTLTAAGPGTVAFSNSTTKTGWTLGAGIEGMMAANWSWKVEYLYMSFPSFTTNAPVGFTGTSSTKVTDNVLRVGFNYHF